MTTDIFWTLLLLNYSDLHHNVCLKYSYDIHRDEGHQYLKIITVITRTTQNAIHINWHILNISECSLPSSVLAIMLWHLFMWWNHLLELCRYSRLGNWASRLRVLITCTWPTSPLLTRCLMLLIAGSNLLRNRTSHVHLLSKSYISKLQVHIINTSTRYEVNYL